MTATNDSALIAARRDLVHHTVTESMQRLSGDLPRPAVQFGLKGGAHGRFVAKRNRVELRVEDFLDDPTVSEARVRATVAHEMGHWSDSTTATQSRRVNIVWSVFGAVGVAAGVAVAVAGHESMWPPAFMLALSALCIVSMGLTARWCWPGEYFADAAAARVVGVAAVIEMVEELPPHRFSPTHPRPVNRIKRLAADRSRTETS